MIREAQSDTKNGTARATDGNISCVAIAFELRQDIGGEYTRATTDQRHCAAVKRHLGRRPLDGILELFNVFSRANYGSYTTNIDSAAYGQPAFNQPRGSAP